MGLLPELLVILSTNYPNVPTAPPITPPFALITLDATSPTNPIELDITEAASFSEDVIIPDYLTEVVAYYT